MGARGASWIVWLAKGWPGWLAAALCAFWLGVWTVLLPPPVREAAESDRAPLHKPRTVALTGKVDKLDPLSSRFAYNLEDVRAGRGAVPRLLLASIPEGIADIVHPGERKTVFLRLMLPLVLEANARVEAQRRFLLSVQKKRSAGIALETGEKLRLGEIAREYRVAPERLDELLLRVDIVPPSIALAQAAIESGWGTSRFALEGNAPFGQWTTDAYRGLVPRERPEGQTYKIRIFDHLLDAVHSYLRNLNTHRAYRAFRRQRARMRAEDGKLDALRLLPTLAPYSQEGARYVRLVEQVIRVNRLQPFDSARLDDGARKVAGAPDA